MSPGSRQSGDLSVLVVGGGPVGLVAALTLARAGVRTHLVERRLQWLSPSLASTLQPPTLALLSDLGVDLTDLGLVAATCEYRGADSSAVFDLGELAGEVALPYRRHLGQQVLCARLLAELAALPTATCRAGVAADLSWSSEYDVVIAADGASSSLRQQAGLTFDGTDYAGTITRLHCAPAPFDSWHPVSYVFGQTESVSVLKLADEVRVIMRPPPTPAVDSPQSRAEEILGVTLKVRSVTQYTAAKRVVSDNTAGNVVFVGDAAHVTNTRGGMNMNAGIHDAVAVARTLASDPAGVQRVAAQRLAVARDLLLPRTDASLAAPQERLAHVSAIHRAGASARRDFLRRSAMLDMMAGVPDAR
ncbi:MAG: FAD-binding protein [Actinobacteria bacterium]|nr:MAG: FAD-binding protein [Actinomycetota bacterium]